MQFVPQWVTAPEGLAGVWSTRSLLIQEASHHRTDCWVLSCDPSSTSGYQYKATSKSVWQFARLVYRSHAFLWHMEVPSRECQRWWHSKQRLPLPRQLRRPWCLQSWDHLPTDGIEDQTSQVAVSVMRFTWRSKNQLWSWSRWWMLKQTRWEHWWSWFSVPEVEWPVRVHALGLFHRKQDICMPCWHRFMNQQNQWHQWAQDTCHSTARGQNTGWADRNGLVVERSNRYRRWDGHRPTCRARSSLLHREVRTWQDWEVPADQSSSADTEITWVSAKRILEVRWRAAHHNQQLHQLLQRV